MSSSYKTRFKDNRLNFDTGIARPPTDHLREKQILYYAPTTGSSHLPAERFKDSLRRYSYQDGTISRKRQEKQQARQWRQESRDEKRNQDHGLEEGPQPGSSVADGTESLRDLGSVSAKKDEGTDRERSGPSLGFIPVEENPALQAIYPEGLERIRERSMNPKTEVEIQQLQLAAGPCAGERHIHR